ncbi:glycerophosphodiester phosphodiesterase [Leptospira sp. GIMC2001]|uniref:glycerophosphodiester phosphodiesterase n=1 Tax=Leptospira sp. GIMC2001 TaxID=1513297 RepID=UPI0023493447|nr:glycerophosphodiester phosphodiesterase [Leptospira sp. GIMC2001]WCL49377.1 glycerophosphodiester phosphodiesterase [Leptospira sp. GIMC2001]
MLFYDLTHTVHNILHSLVFKILSFLTILNFVVSCSSVQVQPSNLDLLDMQGHRGARGLKPENTWPAFRAAIDYKMTTLELDTVLTKDGKVIVHHDSDTNPVICQKLDGTPIEKKNIYDLTLSELKELDCGSKKNPNFPEQITVAGTKLITIEEFFTLVAEAEKQRDGRGQGLGAKGTKLQFNIETKFPNDDQSTVSDEKVQAHVSALLAAIDKAKVTQYTTIQSFYLPALVVVKQKNPKIKTSALFAPSKFQGLMMILGFGNGYREDILTTAKKFKADIVSPYFLYVTPGFVANSKKENIQVIPWTVNEPKEMKRLIGCGVDGIITDYPNRLRDVVLELKGQ